MSLTPPRFHRLAVAAIRQETADAISVTFVVPDHLGPAYAFKAGQYLTLRATLDGTEIRRTYSICAGETDGPPRIAIKRVAGGNFSAWAQNNLRPGVEIDVMTPTGRFGIPPGANGRVHLAIAAGSGITPVLSVLRTVLACEPTSRCILLYGSRATSEILFRGELEDLKDRHLGRLVVQHVLSREQQDITALSGHLDSARIQHLARAVLGGTPVGAAYVCGPEGMMAAAEHALAALDVPADRVAVERFTSTQDGRPRLASPVSAETPAHAIAQITINGITTQIPVVEGEAVLDAALRAGLDLPFACKGGMCCTCRARLTRGTADMAVNYSLQPWEIEAGFVLTCQAQPSAAFVAVDYDQQ